LKTKLTKELEKQDPEELLRLIREMARRFPIANMYLSMEFGIDSDAILLKYKKQLDKEYFPTRGHGKARSSKANRILKEFDKLAAFAQDAAELRFYQIELATQFQKSYDYYYEPFIQNIYANWHTLTVLLHKQGLVDDFQERVNLLLNKTLKGTFFQESLLEIWEEGATELLEEEKKDE